MRANVPCVVLSEPGVSLDHKLGVDHVGVAAAEVFPVRTPGEAWLLNNTEDQLVVRATMQQAVHKYATLGHS